MSKVRANNAAKIKVKCVNALFKRLHSSSFDDVMVREICSDVGISKVTFFKYFSCKEELLRYQYRIWCFHICIDLAKEPYKGKESIYYIFNRVKKDLERTPAFFLAYISYRVKMSRLPAPFPIKAEEKDLLFPGLKDSNIEYKSLEQLVESCVLDAIFSKQINHHNPSEITELLITMIYGMITRRGTTNQSMSGLSIKNAVESIIQYYK